MLRLVPLDPAEWRQPARRVVVNTLTQTTSLNDVEPQS
jgi:hypothetical protein